MKKVTITLCLLAAMSLVSCNQSTTTPGETSPEGTVQTNRTNADMEEHRTSAEVDSIPSPGSNSYDLSTTNSGATGTTTDKNMQNQEDTHGRSTQAGDNGSGGQ